MWLYVVHICRQSDDSLLFTLYAEWMSFKNSSTKALPLVAVTPSGRTSISFRPVRFSLSFHLSITSTTLFKMQVTIFLPKRYRLATSGIFTKRHQ